MPGRARARVRGLRDTCKSSHYRCRIGIIIIVVVVIVLKRNDGRLNAGHNPRNRAGFILKERKAPRTIRERTAGRPTDRPTGRARARTAKARFAFFYARADIALTPAVSSIVSTIML